MKPYLLIEEDEWKATRKHEKEDVVEELAKALHISCPLPEITDKQLLIV